MAQNKDVMELTRRAQHIETELTIHLREQKQNAVKAAAWLHSFTDEDVERLAKVAPMLKTAREITEEQLYNNAHGEFEICRTIYQQVLKHTEEILAYLEGAVC